MSKTRDAHFPNYRCFSATTGWNHSQFSALATLSTELYQLKINSEKLAGSIQDLPKRFNVHCCTLCGIYQLKYFYQEFFWIAFWAFLAVLPVT